MNENECEYCLMPDRYGLLPAQMLTIGQSLHFEAGTRMIHPPIHPVSGFAGVHCKNGPNKDL
jgi:hypothetical protein